MDMKYLVILVISSFLRSSKAQVICKMEDQKKMQERFSNCTAKYKTEYNMAVTLEDDEVQRVTCMLVENIVETCGEEWRLCHDQEDVRRMKDMHVESLLRKNRGAVVDIEQCDTVKQFRSRQIDYEEYTESCSDEEFVQFQADFQSCTHSITTSVNDDIQSLNSLKSISSFLCQAISSISSDCVKHLEKCLDAEDVVIMSENHIEQLKLYFVKLADDKVDDDFNLDNCKEPLSDSAPVNKDIRNVVEFNYVDDGDDYIEDAKKNFEIQSSSNIENEYAMDKQDSEEAIEDKPVEYVSYENVDITTTSNSAHFDMKFSLLLFCFLSLSNQ
eukprot:GFUD01017475.1.p1 GENE.GFUD01017475.1~~GFUD01017475.1.p1  ORF type:complete len:329 (+),score=106.05 GFUD01017475.1:331-1317(+)